MRRRAFARDMLTMAYRYAGAVAAAAVVTLLLGLSAACGGGEQLILATTTSTQDTGLLDVLVPAFEEESGYEVKVIAVGSGQALEMGRRGDADVLLTHAPSSEQELVDEGVAVNRLLLMHNDFIIVGPQSDPAAIRGAPGALAALQAVFDDGAAFISRGDDSGTHQLELQLWEELGLTPAGASWYEKSGQGMGATLQIASQKGAYTLADRGTYLAQEDALELDVLHEGDPRLLNIYHVMQVNPDRFDGVNGAGARAFIAFLVGDQAQAAIGAFGIDRFGRPLFVPDAGKSVDELGLP